MNASKKILSLLDGLADYLLYSDKPTVIQFTDAYGEIYAGITHKIIPALSSECDRYGRALPIIVVFDKIMRVRIIKMYWNRSERYEQIGGDLKPTNMQFGIASLKKEIVKNGAPDLAAVYRTHMLVTDNIRERLVFSSLQCDVKRFNREILGINDPPQT